MSESGKTDRRTLRTVAAIKKAFFDLAELDGYDKVTVSALADRADINRKTFYHHYDSIEGLLDEILRDEALEVAQALRNAAFDERGTVDVAGLFETMSVVIAEMATRNGAVIVNVNPSRVVQLMEPVLQDVISEKVPELFEGVPEECRGFVVTFLCSGLVSAYRHWLEEDSEVEMDELATILSASVTGAIAGVHSCCAE